MSLTYLLRAATFGALAIAAATTASPLFAQSNPPAGETQTPPQAQAPSEPAPPPAAAPAPSSPPATATAPPPPSAPPAAAAPQPPDTQRTAFATTNLNLRSGPGTDMPVITVIPAGSAVRVTSCEAEWCAVQWNGHDGHAIARNLGAQRPRPVRRYAAQPYYEPPPPVVYGPPAYYYPPPPVYYRPYYYRPRYYYGPGWGWRRRW